MENISKTNDVLNVEKRYILQLVFSGLSILFNIISLITKTNTFVGWLGFVALGLGIYALMSTIVAAFRSERFAIISSSGALIGIILSVIVIIMYSNTLMAFISTLV